MRPICRRKALPTHWLPTCKFDTVTQNPNMARFVMLVFGFPSVHDTVVPNRKPARGLSGEAKAPRQRLRPCKRRPQRSVAARELYRHKRPARRLRLRACSCSMTSSSGWRKMGVGETVFASPRESPADCSVRVFARRSTGRYMSAPSLITVVRLQAYPDRGPKTRAKSKGKGSGKGKGKGIQAPGRG